MSIESNSAYNPSTRIGEVSGVAYYASVTTPNTTFEPHKWELNLVVDEKALDEFSARGFTIKEKDFGRCINFKRNVTRKGGGTNNRPILVNENRKRVDELPKIGNGSKVKVHYEEIKGVGDKTKNPYHILDLKAVMILNLVELEATSQADGSVFFEDGDF